MDILYRILLPTRRSVFNKKVMQNCANHKRSCDGPCLEFILFLFPIYRDAVTPFGPVGIVGMRVILYTPFILFLIRLLLTYYQQHTTLIHAISTQRKSLSVRKYVNNSIYLEFNITYIVICTKNMKDSGIMYYLCLKRDKCFKC